MKSPKLMWESISANNKAGSSLRTVHSCWSSAYAQHVVCSRRLHLLMSLSESEAADLKTEALKARDFSYSPYSNFRVGCAVLTSDGHVITGANVENASYGGAICAERTAIVRSVASGHRKFRAIAISSDQAAPISPCGICRQVIREFFDLAAPVYMYLADGTHCVMKTLDELLPLSFGPENLGK